MDQARFVTQTNRFHDDRSQCFISGRYKFPFSFILLLSVCCWQTSPGSCYSYFYLAICLSPIFPQLKQIILVQCQGTAGLQFRTECRSSETRSFRGPYFLFSFTLILYWYLSFISSLSIFSLCAVPLSMRPAPVAHYKYLYKYPVTFCFLFSCLHMSYFGEVCQLPPAVGLPVSHLGGAEQLCSWLS